MFEICHKYKYPNNETNETNETNKTNETIYTNQTNPCQMVLIKLV